MEVIIKKFLLVLFCFYSAFFFAGSLLAPVLAHYHFYDLSAVLTSTFMFSCHQQPDRSFWVLGYPVALCARCLGFYLGVMLTSGFMVFKQIKINRLITNNSISTFSYNVSNSPSVDIIITINRRNKSK